MKNRITNLGFSFFDALLNKEYESIKSIYQSLIDLSSESNYRKIVRRVVGAYEEKKPDSELTCWQISLFVSPEMPRLEEYLEAPVNNK